MSKTYSAYDVQKHKLDKLMSDIDKPVYIPESRGERQFPDAPEFVRNIMGSSAGAGSGEFHVYRHLRRKEYARQKFITSQAIKEEKDLEFQARLEQNKKEAEEKTQKKRLKRLKKKQKKNVKKAKTCSETKDDDEDSGDDDDQIKDRDSNMEEKSSESHEEEVIQEVVVKNSWSQRRRRSPWTWTCWLDCEWSGGRYD